MSTPTIAMVRLPLKSGCQPAAVRMSSSCERRPPLRGEKEPSNAAVGHDKLPGDLGAGGPDKVQRLRIDGTEGKEVDARTAQGFDAPAVFGDLLGAAAQTCRVTFRAAGEGIIPDTAALEEG
jgi:hypothetical protein